MYWPIIKSFLAIFFAGLSIKLMDDILDDREDKTIGKKTWAQAAGRGAVPYALLALFLAIMLDWERGGSLFLASYVIGMGSSLEQKEGIGLPAWFESATGGILGLVIFGFPVMSSSLTVIISIDIMDDVIDRYSLETSFNLAQNICLFIAFLCLSLALDFEKTLLTFLALLPVLYLMERKWSECLFRPW